MVLDLDSDVSEWWRYSKSFDVEESPENERADVATEKGKTSNVFQAPGAQEAAVKFSSPCAARAVTSFGRRRVSSRVP